MLVNNICKLLKHYTLCYAQHLPCVSFWETSPELAWKVSWLPLLKILTGSSGLPLTLQNPGLYSHLLRCACPVSCWSFVTHEGNSRDFLLTNKCPSPFPCWCCHLFGCKILGCRKLCLNPWEYFSLSMKQEIYRHVLSSERQSQTDCLWERIWLRTFRLLVHSWWLALLIPQSQTFIPLSYSIVTAVWNMSSWRNNPHPACSKS